MPSRSVIVLQEDFLDQQSDRPPEVHIFLEVAHVRSEYSNWRNLQKRYYSRASDHDVALEEKPNISQNNYNANNIYEWSINACSEYNILSKLQQMTMVANSYRTSYDCSDQLTTHVLVAGFTGQLKGWWDTHIIEKDKQNIFQSVRIDPLGSPILKEGHIIPDSTNL